MIEQRAVDYINRQLRSRYGINTSDSRSMFRVLWSEYTEKRRSNFTESGIELIHSEVMELPKYNYIKDRWVLERLVIIPTENLKDLPIDSHSYEPLWVFEDKDKNPLPPRLDACLLIIDTLYAALGKKSLKRYVDNLTNQTKEAREERIKNLMEQLFGDESDLHGRTITGEAIAMPNNFNRSMIGE